MGKWKASLLTVLYGILAGICIAIGGTAYLVSENPYAAAFMFTVGLFTICIFQFYLFTGRVCSFSTVKEKVPYLWDLVLIWVGNWIGTFCAAKLEQLTRLGSRLSEKAAVLCAVKTQDDLLSLFILAVFCNILIYIAVEGFKSARDSLGSYLSIFFGVTIFVFCGFEHCVADMYYFSLADIWNAWHSWVCILVITLGNAVGGILFDYLRRLRKQG